MISTREHHYDFKQRAIGEALSIIFINVNMEFKVIFLAFALVAVMMPGNLSSARKMKSEECPGKC